MGVGVGVGVDEGLWVGECAAVAVALSAWDGVGEMLGKVGALGETAGVSVGPTDGLGALEQPVAAMMRIIMARGPVSRCTQLECAFLMALPCLDRAADSCRDGLSLFQIGPLGWGTPVSHAF